MIHLLVSCLFDVRELLGGLHSIHQNFEQACRLLSCVTGLGGSGTVPEARMAREGASEGKREGRAFAGAPRDGRRK